ncbi:putative hemolymph juvenile hormone binding protein JHBP-like 6 [Homarus americanus]|uniref:Putative hemolymph juvenile hormone binding protein JHBP-like 6 n=1 Tax=Homarus americanus TaxID=6706 RepID=A0A8J5MNR5_HOMAM|nr:putative hemolymph juvenile hormone binding protein JHBP-like 6 [Homarus americanus]
MGPTTRLGMVVVMVLALLQGTQAAPGYLQSPGVKSFTAHDCTYDDAGNDKKSVVLKFQSPQLKIKTPAYVINGTVVDHIDLHGKGPASFIIDDFDLSVAVKGIINISGKVITMVVDFEGLMPESDLGEVFNEFFSEHGPELFDILEDKINKSGKLVEFLNSLFPPKTSAATLHSDVEP